MEDNKLFLLDAYALIYRAYYALMRSPRVTSQGFNTSAIFGFVNTLHDVLRRENPAYMAVCFDPRGGHTFRHEVYPEYKATRDKQPEDITAAIPYIKDILEAYGIRMIEVEGYEADDVIGTLARRAEADGYTTYMMTPDKDYGQLVTDKVLMYRPGRRGEDFEIRGPQEICERYGIDRPSQVIDLLALEGDASDNVPGCPGVGEKTAAKLIREWGSVENILEHVNDLKGAVQHRVSHNVEQIRFSKFLVTINTDVPLPEGTGTASLRRGEPDFGRLRKIFDRLEFKTLVHKLDIQMSARPEIRHASLFDEPELPVKERITITYDDISAPDDIARFVSEVMEAGVAGVSVEAVGEQAMTAEIAGFAISTERRSAYIPAGLFSGERQEIAALLAPLFAGYGPRLVSHDVKRDMVLLSRLNIDWTAPWFDTSVAHYLLSPEGKHDMATVALTYLCHKTHDYDLTAPERRKVRGPQPALAVERAILARMLEPKLTGELRAQQLLTLYTDIENPLVPVLARMEREGVRIDSRELDAMARSLTAQLHGLETRAYELAGHTFNLSSPAQVGEVLFGELAIDPDAKRNKKGSWSTTEDILEKLADRHPLVNVILEIRGVRKLLTTYVEALPKLINPATGRIHTTFNQTVTATGRISSSNPNLQNIPVRSEGGREIRRAFIPAPGDLILSADYSQIELRLMADISGDEGMLEAFNAGEDIHRSTAAKIFHIPLDQVTDDQRRRAKTANFGIIYGISAFGLSERLGIPRAEARGLITNYMYTYPRIEQYMKDIVERARADGYVTTIHGRKRLLPEINSRNGALRGYAERNAINAPLQGTAADIIKIAMIDIDAEIRRLGLRSRMIMQVHDELIFNVVPDELARVQSLVVDKMEHAYSGRVRLEVSSGTGRNWLEAH